MEHLFIVNPKAGKTDQTEELKKKVERAMSGRGESYRLERTEYPGHAREIAADAASKGTPIRVYACGGDGTLNEVLNGIVPFPNAELTHYPCGTGNDFVRSFERAKSRFQSIEELSNGESLLFDLIRCQDRYSLNICSCGMDARIAGDVHLFSKIPGIRPFAAFSLSAMVHLFKGIHRPYGVEIDGVDYSGDYTLLVGCNARYYGGGYNPSPDADPTDGFLDFILVRAVSRLQVLQLIQKYSKGQIDALGDRAVCVRGKKMRIDCGENADTVNIDGETLKDRRIEIALAEHQVRFFAPVGSFESLKLKNVSK